ncbi:metallochaperone Sco1 [Capsaspora owczarzaki ATCC 30864]|uniref:Metallochaperone Sco1 n=1 Tax=Capsaspora owczarzaki (strain ATCC 30864) TaxID=595528 RepID=A0A0D2X336_CAPO3|nr:metallochaperone Sco1 [Capsaspora owczarzaki ATCC 30864]KJE93624.1 metallochaperone Sco1 [Capsaspora owczarzaki ATCC 30864]|eukprot:XP_004348211.1 metallochaperone Sco1 [Capsaspora owczarzaki ATCC 30864]
MLSRLALSAVRLGRPSPLAVSSTSSLARRCFASSNEAPPKKSEPSEATSSSNKLSFEEEAARQIRNAELIRDTRGKNEEFNKGPVTWVSLGLLAVAGAGLVMYFQSERANHRANLEAKRNRGLGVPKIGGPFTLVDTNGKRWTEEDLKGRWTLIYFGFTFCPDVCPDELDKMTEIVNTIDNTPDIGPVVTPLFISVDPMRDNAKIMGEYLAANAFHPRIVGLTGTTEEVHQVARAYRVYFSAGMPENPADDYLVDHTIIQYFMNPEGKFATYYGQTTTAQDAAKRLIQSIREYRADAPERERASLMAELDAAKAAASNPTAQGATPPPRQ